MIESEFRFSRAVRPDLSERFSWSIRELVLECIYNTIVIALYPTAALLSKKSIIAVLRYQKDTYILNKEKVRGEFLGKVSKE